MVVLSPGSPKIIHSHSVSFRKPHTTPNYQISVAYNNIYFSPSLHIGGYGSTTVPLWPMFLGSIAQVDNPALVETFLMAKGKE